MSSQFLNLQINKLLSNIQIAYQHIEMDTQDKGRALPFISFNEKQGFYLNKEAEQFLQSLDDAHLGVISIVGKYRTGKSFFINRVLLNTKKDGFSVGPTVNPCTKVKIIFAKLTQQGLWLWNKTLSSDNPEHENMKVLVMDTEGFAGLDEHANHDNKIFLFSLLLSSFYIYNSVGNIDENALQSLSLIIELAKEIQVKTKGVETDPEELAQYFPTFLWVVRDFALRLIDTAGNPITSKDYLENALQQQKGLNDSIEARNRIRRLFKTFFKERDCCTMVRPLEDEKELQKLDELSDEKLRSEFLEQMRNVKKRIFKKVKPKTINGKPLTGPMLLEITKAYILAINSGSVPNIENAWTYLCKQESHKALEESLTFVESKLGEKRDKPLESIELRNFKNTLKDEMVAFFKKKALGNSEELKPHIEEMEKAFDERYSKFKEKNKEEWRKVFSKWISQQAKVEEKLKHEQYTNYFEFQSEMEKLKEQFEKEAPQGLSKDTFWKDFSQKMYAHAAQQLTRKAEEQYSFENRRLAQKLEMTENELSTRKKDYETEKQGLYDRLHEIERERAYFKAQEATIQEKVSTLKQEKEKYEKLYNESVQKSKEREDKIEKEHRERVSELEKIIDTIKTDSNFKNSNFDKRVALLEQELQFTKRENNNLREKCERFDEERMRLNNDLRKKEEMLEERKKRLAEVEIAKQQEISGLRLELERKVKEMENDDRRKGDSKSQSEWVMEKTYLENQVNFLKSQLEENRRLHDALLLALEQNMGPGNNENEGNHDLVETNKNLSVTVEKMEARCKIFEEKIEKLKKYKRMVKNSAALQCLHCSKFISCNIFIQHITNCVNNLASGMPKTSLMSTMSSSVVPNPHSANSSQMQPTHQHSNSVFQSRFDDQPAIDANLLQISINQTMIKENSDSKLYTEYLIQIAYNTAKWSVSRKYKTFAELHQQLKTHFPSLQFPESALTILGGFNNSNYNSHSKKPVVVEERRRAYQQFLRDLAKIDIVRNSTPFKRFLELDRALDADYSDKPGKGITMSALNSYRDEKKISVSNLPSERNNNEEYTNFNNIYPPQRTMDSNYNPEESVHGDDLLPQKDLGVKVDKRMFTQSPQSFMKNWQEKQQVNKENKNPSRSRSVSENYNLTQKVQREREEEADMNKIENIDFSDIGYADQQQYIGGDYSHERSLLQQLRSDPNSTAGANSSVGYRSGDGQGSSPFGGYLSEKGYAPTQFGNSAGGKNVKLNIADLQSQQVPQKGSGNHARYSSSIEAGMNSYTNSLKSSIARSAQPQSQIQPQLDPKSISQKNYRNLKNSAMSNSPMSPSKYYPKTYNERASSMSRDTSSNVNQNIRLSAQFNKNSLQNAQLQISA